MSQFPSEQILTDPSVVNFQYVGRGVHGSLTSDAKWKIFRVEYSNGSIIDVKYANGNEEQINIWDNRLTLDYK